MTTTVSGGGGGMSIAGLTSDNAHGINVAGSVAVSPDVGPLDPPGIDAGGRIVLFDTAATMENNIDNVSLSQSFPVDANGGGAIESLVRAGDISLHDYASPMHQLIDFTNSAQPVARYRKGGVTVLEIGTIKSITGHLSAVTDVNAKAVLTSLIALATGIKVATDNTT